MYVYVCIYRVYVRTGTAEIAYTLHYHVNCNLYADLISISHMKTLSLSPNNSIYTNIYDSHLAGCVTLEGYMYLQVQINVHGNPLKPLYSELFFL